MEGTRLFGMGLGVIIIIIVWSIAFAICCIVSQIEGNYFVIGFSSVLIAGIVTTILFVIPRSSETKLDDVVVPIVDEFIIYRIILLIVMALTFFIGLTVMITTHWATPVQARPMKKTKLM